MKQYFTKIFVFFHLLVVTSCYPYETASQTSHGQISIPNLILENTDLDYEGVWQLVTDSLAQKVAVMGARDNSYLTILTNGSSHTVRFDSKGEQCGYSSVIPLTEFSQTYADLYYSPDIRDVTHDDNGLLDTHYFYFEDGTTIELVVSQGVKYFSIIMRK